MGIHTPIDRHFRFGEMYGIRKSYNSMTRSIEERNIENSLFDLMMKQMVESGNLDKIERFARKNSTLRDFAIENSVQEAIASMNESTLGLNIPKTIKKNASNRLMDAVSKKALSIKVNEFKFPSFTKPVREPTIIESEMDADEFLASQENQSDNIERLINNVAIKRGIIGKEDLIQSKTDAEFQNNLENENDFDKTVKHNYSIRNVILESIASNSKKTKLIPPTTLYTYGDGGDERDYLNTTIKSVVNGINAICGINFQEDDYIWLQNGRPSPFFKCEVVVTADLVKGNKLLNAYFGPTGQFKDYLYRADNTPRIEPSKAMHMSQIDKDVNAISSYPIIRVYSTVISWDIVNGEERLRSIDESDFNGTKIRFVN